MALTKKANKLFVAGLIPGDVDTKAQDKIEKLSNAEIDALISIQQKLHFKGRMFKKRQGGGATSDCGF
jgi:hypothetical protein